MSFLPRRATATIALVAVGTALVVGLPTPATASDIAPLETRFATDVVFAGVSGLRDVGAGSITVAGVTGTVSRSYLYWHGPTNSADLAVNAQVAVNGTPVTGTNIGQSSDNCWGFQNSEAYRADVTALVTADGSYALTNMTKTDAQVNGASLVVFFDDGDTTNNRDVVMFDGNDSNQTNAFDAAGWNIALSGINYVSGAASLQFVVSDGQTFGDGPVALNGTELVAADSWQGDTVPLAVGGSDNSGFLWDHRSADITARLTPGVNDLAVTSGYINDCLSLIVAAVVLPAGAAPNQPTTTTTTPTTVAPTSTVAPTTTRVIPVVNPTFTG